MLNIRPVSDPRNRFPEIGHTVMESGEPVILTKNGCGSPTALSSEDYSAPTDHADLLLDEADKAAGLTDERLTGDEVFDRARRRIHERKAN